MGGWRTWTAAIGSWMAGSVPILMGISTGDPDKMMEGINAGLPYLLGGFGAWGLGRKIEKPKK